MDNVVYHWGDYAERNAQYVDMELKLANHYRLNMGRRDHHRSKYFLLTNSITWDLEFRDVPAYLSGISKIIHAIRHNTLSGPAGLRIVYMSGVGYANNFPSIPMNGYVHRALNNIVLDTMTEAGIEVLDIYNMLYSVNDKYVNPMHYLFVYPDSQKVAGEYGSVVADAIISTMCLV